MGLPFFSPPETFSPDYAVKRGVSGEPGVAKTPKRAASKFFWPLARRSIGLIWLRTALTTVSCLEAECIVFATEGLLLTHDSPSTAEFGLGEVSRDVDVEGRLADLDQF